MLYVNHISVKLKKVEKNIGEWINYLRYSHTMDYYSAIKRNALLIHATIMDESQNNFERRQKDYLPYGCIYIKL